MSRRWGVLTSAALLAVALGGCSQADSLKGPGPVEDDSMTTTQPVGAASEPPEGGGLERTPPTPVAVEATAAEPTSDDAPVTTAVEAATPAEPSGPRSQPQPSTEPSGPRSQPQPSTEPSGSEAQPQPSTEPSGSEAQPQPSAEALAPPVAAQEEARTDRPAPTAAVDEFIYPDEPEPAESVVSTLCNLSQDHLTALRNEDSAGRPVVDDDLRMSVLALSDQLSYWETLRSSYPQAAPDIDRAAQVYDLWDSAVLSQENGETATAQGAMTKADQVIDAVTNSARPDDGCIG